MAHYNGVEVNILDSWTHRGQTIYKIEGAGNATVRDKHTRDEFGFVFEGEVSGDQNHAS